MKRKQDHDFQPVFSGIFTDNAVLQHGISIPVWGRAAPGALVECELAGRRARVRASAEGRFFLRLPALPPGGPHEMILRDVERGKETAVRNLMAGEVWLASGQSNMALSLSDLPGKLPAGNSHVRFFKVEERTETEASETVYGQWREACAPHLGNCSAVAFHFASELAKELGITVGILQAARGASRIEAWIPREDLLQTSFGRKRVRLCEASLYAPETWENYRVGSDPETILPDRLEELFDLENLPVFGERNRWHAPEYRDAHWKEVIPGDFDSMGFHSNGAIWLRKEFTADSGKTAHDRTLECPVMGNGILYLNGTRLNDFVLPARLLKTGINLLALRICAPLGQGGIQNGQAPRIVSGQEVLPLPGTWRMKVELDLTRTREIRPGLPPRERFRAMMRAFAPYMKIADGEEMVQPSRFLSGPGIWNSPHILFDNMIRPLIPYGLRGVVWYQGESSVDDWSEYAEPGRKLMDSWRRSWGQGDFPFYQVQLAAFGVPEAFQEKSAWAGLREAQKKVSDNPGSGLISLIDCDTPETIHPPDKKTPGRRLAALALSDTYGKAVPCHGPVFRKMEAEGSRLRLFFDHAGGLHGTGGFFIAGRELRFFPAQIRVDGCCVLAESPEVPAPEQIRYAWADNPAGSDFRNGDGLPMLPFRSDSFPEKL